MLQNTDVRWLMDVSYFQLLRFLSVSTYPGFGDAFLCSAIVIGTGERE